MYTWKINGSVCVVILDNNIIVLAGNTKIGYRMHPCAQIPCDSNIIKLYMFLMQVLKTK